MLKVVENHTLCRKYFTLKLRLAERKIFYLGLYVDGRPSSGSSVRRTRREQTFLQRSFQTAAFENYLSEGVGGGQQLIVPHGKEVS